MASPRRTAVPLADLGIRRLGSTLAGTIGAEIELGWSALRLELRDAGWPARTPDDDRKPSTRPSDPPAIDYADPTGDLVANRVSAMLDDLLALEDHRSLIETSIRALRQLAGKYRPPATPAVPACSVSQCVNPVESTGRGGYRDMEQIGGVWCALPNRRPVCASHRKRTERGVA